MDEEILRRILKEELKLELEPIKSEITSMKKDIIELKTDVAELKTDVAELKADVAELKTDVAKLKTDVIDLKTGQAKIINMLESLETTNATRHMEIALKLEELKELKQVTKENCYDIAKLKAVK